MPYKFNPFTGAFDAVQALQPGWSVVSTRPFHHPSSVAAATATRQTTRSMQVATTAIKAIRLIYANWHSANATGGVPNPNPIVIRASVQLKGSGVNGNEVAGDPVYRALFNGRDTITLGRGKWIISDPISIGMTAGQVY